VNSWALGLFDAAFASSREATLLVTDDLRCLDANEAAERFFGCARSALVGGAIGERVKVARPIEAHVTKLRGALWLVRFHERDELAASVARTTHDLNNALAIVATYATTKPAPNIEHIRASVEHATAIAHQLEGLVRAERPLREVVVLNALVTRLVPLLHATLGDAIELRLHSTAPLAAVVANVTQLERVMSNLAINAREAMPSGGAFSITTSNASGFVVLTVSDTGRGLDAGARSLSFDRRYSTKGVGRGSGLAIVAAIVEQHGGEIRLTSAPGESASFEIRLPRYRE